MKKLFLSAIFAVLCWSANAADVVWKKVEASELTLLGKAFDTPNPYHRVDTCVYKGFTKGENWQCRVPAGLTVMFKTDARNIGVSVQFGKDVNMGAYCSYRGFDLYIKKDGKWLWAGCTTFGNGKDPSLVRELVKDMAPGEKECLLYLPLYSEMYQCKVCVPEGSTLEALESPFRHKIVFHGSSFTHGISCTRAGMSYPMQFMRHTGLQVLSLGVSGNCKMQPYFAAVLEDVEADAYVFDSFSNPDAKMIEERLIPFIDRMVAAHPGKPLIFQQTIYRESRNFSLSIDKREQDKMDMAEKIFREIVFSKENREKYKDVYFITPNASCNHESSVDGTHPDNYGYYLWARSIEKPVLKILRKYGIR